LGANLAGPVQTVRQLQSALGLPYTPGPFVDLRKTQEQAAAMSSELSRLADEVAKAAAELRETLDAD